MKRFAITAACLLVGTLFVFPALAQTRPPLSFGKTFDPSTIGIGSTSTLTFTITNDAAVSADNLSFTDVLPTNVIIATPSSAFTDCGSGALSAPDGGTTIELTGGQLGPGDACIVSVNVTSSVTGSHDNLSGDLTSDNLGSGGTAQATLDVDPNRPGFRKSFVPSSISPGQTSTLIFTIDNTENDVALNSLEFTDNLPDGLVVASPSNASTTCPSGSTPSTLTATPGANFISFSAPDVLLDYGTTCTVSVDVTAPNAGVFDNISSNLQVNISGEGDGGKISGFATARLNVSSDFLYKSFTDDPVPPGGTVTLEFTIQNPSRTETATNLGFTDDLGFLTGLAPAETLPKVVCGGTLSFAPSVLTFSGGSLAPEGTCTFSVLLLVPLGADPGVYTNTTNAITGEVGGSPVTGNTATDELSVAPEPILTKTFTDDPVGAGGAVTLEFTITNTSPTTEATNIAFTDVFDPIILSASSVPADGSCGPSSTFVFTPPGGVTPASLAVSDASLAAGASCTFSIVLDLEAGVGGTYTNTTSEITATVGRSTYTGDRATDDLVVVPAPLLLKSFTDDPVLPGDLVTLEFTLTHDEFAPGDATDISFTDDLDATLPGLTATGATTNDCGGMAAGFPTDLFDYSGGSLMPGETCTIILTLDVPTEAAAGPHTNTTSDVTATVDGVTATGRSASDDLKIAALTLTKSFTDDPVLPGGTVTLEFTIENVSPTANATNIFFQDDLDDVLTGLVSISGPQFTICGGSSSISGTDLLTFTGGSLGPGGMCTFSVTLQVPAGAASETYVNTTSDFQATIDGTPATFDDATDDLIVEARQLAFTKSFTDDPATPGGTVTLEFTLTNLDGAKAVSDLAFSDDLDAALSGLLATAALFNDCGGMATSGFPTGLFAYDGGALGAGASCTITLTLDVPAGALDGTYTNTTSDVTGTIDAPGSPLDGLGVTGDPASDDLVVIGERALLDLRVILGGTYEPSPTAAALRVGGLAPARILAATPVMQTNLSAVLPETDPYLGTKSVAPGFFSTPTGLTVVDWVLVKLVTGDPTSGSVNVEAQQPGLLLDNGSVVDTDGTSPLAFNVADGLYRIVVCHRNHFGALSSVALLFRRGGAAVVYDFTTAQTQAYDDPGDTDLPLYDLSPGDGNPTNGPFSLVPGDLNQDGLVKYLGSGSDRALILAATGSLTGVLPGYHVEDATLNAEVKYLGSGNDRSLILVITGSLTGLRQSQVPTLVTGAAPAVPTAMPAVINH